MIRVVGVRFKKAGKIYYFDPQSLEINLGESVIVETARGQELGEVVVPPKMVAEEDVVQPLKPVVRKAAPDDLTILKENRHLEDQAFSIGLEKIAKHQLPMKLVEVEYTFDRNKIVFYFTSDGRVDFRELVKDLAAVFRTRIELRQIGVRDEAKMIGGLGPCGRTMCCATFLGDFDPVSIRMAKEQNLSLNPTKISGICGRLMCCLRFESDSYKDGKDSPCSACEGCGGELEEEETTELFGEGIEEGFIRSGGTGEERVGKVPSEETEPPESPAENGNRFRKSNKKRRRKKPYRNKGGESGGHKTKRC